MTSPIGAAAATSAAAEQLFAAAGGTGSSGSTLSKLTDDDKAVIKAAFGPNSIGRTSVGVAFDIDTWRDMGKLKDGEKLTTTSLTRAFGADAVHSGWQLAKIYDVLRTRETAETASPGATTADTSDAAGNSFARLTDDDKVIIRAAFGQGSLRNTSPEVAIGLELARGMGKLRGDEKLTTTNLRQAFGDAVDTDPQLSKIYALLRNRELGDVDVLAQRQRLRGTVTVDSRAPCLR
jgi:hypothetical protein